MQTTPLSNKADQCTPSHPREVDNGVGRTSGGWEPGAEATQDGVQGTTLPPAYTPNAMPAPVPTHTYPSPGLAHPASQPASPEHSVARPTSTSVSPTAPTPAVITVPASSLSRPQRTRRPKTLFNPGTWDLSGLEEDSPTLTRKQVSDLFLYMAQKLDKGL